ncbi:histone deacetylase 14 [Tanacetum coccineum]
MMKSTEKLIFFFIPHEEGNDPDLELAMKLSLETPQEKGEGEGDDADLERAIKLSLDPALLPQGRAPVGGVTIREPGSEATPKRHEVVGKGKAVVTEEQVAHSLVTLSKKKRTTDQFVFARRDQSPPDSTTGPSSQPEDDTSEKVVNSLVYCYIRIKAFLYQTLTKAMRLRLDQPCAMQRRPDCLPKGFMNKPEAHNKRTGLNDKPESHSGSMSSLKNLDDSFNFGDQFLHDKPTEDDQEKSKAREESDSNIPDRSHQKKMSEVKKTDVLASIRSQVPTAVDNYLGTKLDDALLKSLVKESGIWKEYEGIIKAKKEQDEEKQIQLTPIRSTDKVDLEGILI